MVNQEYRTKAQVDGQIDAKLNGAGLTATSEVAVAVLKSLEAKESAAKALASETASGQNKDTAINRALVATEKAEESRLFALAAKADAEITIANAGIAFENAGISTQKLTETAELAAQALASKNQSEAALLTATQRATASGISAAASDVAKGLSEGAKQIAIQEAGNSGISAGQSAASASNALVSRNQAEGFKNESSIIRQDILNLLPNFPKPAVFAINQRAINQNAIFGQKLRPTNDFLKANDVLNPSLVMVPSAFKTGELYSVIPTNGTGDFTVSRNGAGTFLGKDGLIKTALANEPRFEYNSDGTFKGVLVEPAATNILRNSDNLLSFSSNESNNSLIVNQISSIELGLKTESTNFINYVVNEGEEIAISGRNKTSIFTSSVSEVADTQVSISCYVKYNGYNSVYIGNGSSSNLGNFKGCVFHFNTETIEVIELSVINVKFEKLSNGWFRISCSFISTTSTNSRYAVGAFPNGTLGDGVKGIYFFGFQLELGTVATSYIPTLDSQVTRPADVITKNNAQNLIGQTEGTIYCEVTTKHTSVFRRFFIVVENNTLNGLSLIYSSANRLEIAYLDVNDVTRYISVATINNSVLKVVLGYNVILKSLLFVVNGIVVLNVTDWKVDSLILNNITLGSRGGIQVTQDNYRVFTLSKFLLTDQQAITLTTL